MVKLWDGPVHEIPPLLKTGVTTTVEVTGEVPVLVPVKDGMSPVPAEAKPMLVVLLVHV